MALPHPSWSAETEELYDLEYLAHGTGVRSEDDFEVIQHPSVNRQLMSVDEKLYQRPDETLESTAFENLSLAEVVDDTDAGFDRWDY